MDPLLIRETDAAGSSTTAITNDPQVIRLPRSNFALTDILEALPEAVYTTDAKGLITFYNKAAIDLWGVTPELGKSEFCGSWKLYWPDGTPLPHDECPMAMALRERRAIRGMEAVAERPDGTRIGFLAFPTPLFDVDGNLAGAVNMLIDLADRSAANEAAQRLAAIVESSDDAIIAKDLNGTIISWNRGAERLFGYTAEETIGNPVAMLIPLERHDEEPNILARLRRGDRIDHYETVRQRKDGSLIDISLTVSPIRNLAGRIIGASKIARDITERRRAEEQQRLLMREMDHRVKNLFTLAISLVQLSARSAETPADLASAVSARLNALAQAHALTAPRPSDAAGNEQATTLHALIQTILAPYAGCDDNHQSRAVVTGVDVPISGDATTGFALLLHEFATNAAKYGSLSVAEGTVDIDCREDGGRLILEWTEKGGPPVDFAADSEGFGTRLAKATVRSQLGGEITRDWKPEGLSIRLVVAIDRFG